MRLRYSLCALAALLLGLGPVSGQTLTTSLSGANEVPPVDTDATGSVSVVLYEGVEQDTVIVGGTFSGLESDYATTIGSHLHGGAAGENGPVRYALTPTLDTDNRGGTFNPRDNKFAVRKTFADSLLNGLVYVNIHTVGNMGGEIRGQLRPATPIAVGDIVINEFLADPAPDAAGDANNDGTRESSQDEFIELVNTTTADIDLSGYVIEDAASQSNATDPAFIRHFFPAGSVVPAGGAIVVFGGGTPTGAFGNAVVQTAQNPTTTFSPQLGLNNGGDIITLATSNITGGVGGTVVAEYEYTAGIDDQSFARNPDLTGDFVAHSLIREGVLFSPGLVNVSGEPFVPSVALVQVIHNAPDPDAALVDVYVNDVLLLDDFAFRTATPYVNLAAGIETTIDVTAADAADNAAPVYSVTVPNGLTAGSTVQLIASGVLDDTPADDSDDTADEFQIVVAPSAQVAASVPTEVDVRVVHGSPDAPTVDVRSGGTVLVNDISYPDFTDFLGLAPADYVLDITTADGAPVASFNAPLSGAAGMAVTVLASGFLTPPSEAAPAFGLLAVFADGTELLLSVATSNEGDPESGLSLSVVNPLRSGATVGYSLSRPGAARVALYDVLGRQVAVLADGEVGTAPQTAQVDASALASGVYVLRLETETGALSRTVTVVR